MASAQIDPNDPEAVLRQRIGGQLGGDLNFAGGSSTFDEATGGTYTGGGGENTIQASPSFLAGDQVSPNTGVLDPSHVSDRVPVPLGDATTQATTGGPLAGSIAPTQTGYAPVSGADLQVRQAPISTTSFYNANTGAAAHYDPASGMYVDTNGQQIRPDAIRTNNPGQFSGQPSAPAVAGPAVGGGASASPNAWRDQIRAIIMQRLGLAQQPVDPNSLEISTALGAAKDQLSRQSDVERNALAERLYAQGGLNTGAVGQQIQQSNERQGTALSTLRANLITNEYNQKRQELQHLLDIATQSGDNESARDVQIQLANLDAAVRREGLGVNLAEFQAQLNSNTALAGLRG